MESGAIRDSQISASSRASSNRGARQARLHLRPDGEKTGGWSAKREDLHQWLQVDLGNTTRVTGVATQGRYKFEQWVEQYKLQYGEDGQAFTFYKGDEGYSSKDKV